MRVGLHQGSSISPYLFDLVMDVMSRGIKDQAPWCMLFADDIVICCNSREEVEQKTECWRRALEDRGLKVSRSKTEYLSFNDESVGDVRLEGNTMKRVGNFNYLGSTVAENGDLDREITHRIQAGWKNWKKLSGVLCD